MNYTTVFAKAMQTLDQRKDRSAWGRGVNGYAVDMLQHIADYYKGGYISVDDLATWTTAEAAALDGAGVDTLAGLDYKITYKAVTSSRLGSKALKADQPELYSKYTKQTTARRFCLA